MSKQKAAADELRALMNVGPAMRKDLSILDIESVAQLATQDPDLMYLQLQERTGQRQDPCVWDVFAAIVHQARTGEAKPWWHWTSERKQRQAAGAFLHRADDDKVTR